MGNNEYPTILVLGASGTIGKQVVKELEGKSVNVRSCHAELAKLVLVS